MARTSKKAKYPGFIFYTQDYFGDTAVRLTPIELRLCWIEMFLLMDRSPRRGVLLQPNGDLYTDDDLAQAINTTPDIIRAAREYVIEKKIASLDPRTGALVSRRMVRDTKKRLTNSRNGKRGGNPELKNAPKSAKKMHQKRTQKPNGNGLEDTAVNPTYHRPHEESVNRRLKASDKAKPDPDPDPDPEPFPFLQQDSLNSRSFVPQQAAEKTDGRTVFPKRDFQSFWGPVEGYLRRNIVEESFQQFYAGCRILDLTSQFVVLAVPGALIERNHGPELTGILLGSAIAQSKTGLLRDRRLKIVPLESLEAKEA